MDRHPNSTQLGTCSGRAGRRLSDGLAEIVGLKAAPVTEAAAGSGDVTAVGFDDAFAMASPMPAPP